MPLCARGGLFVCAGDIHAYRVRTANSCRWQFHTGRSPGRVRIATWPRLLERSGGARNWNELTSTKAGIAIFRRARASGITRARDRVGPNLFANSTHALERAQARGVAFPDGSHPAWGLRSAGWTEAAQRC